MDDLKILLVEDNVINQMVVNKCLSNRGIKVVIANHGKEALDLIQTKDFQFVLMDFHMPEMDGLESTSKIRSMDDTYFRNVPIILFSATSVLNTKEKAEAKAIGITDFMNKPLVLDQLDYMINTYVRNKKSYNRPLNINFEDYTDNDSEFKQELIDLMINDMRELQQSFHIATAEGDNEIFRSTCHKIVGTINILNDTEFTDVIEDLKIQGSERDRIIHFDKLSYDIIKSLACESEMVQNIAET